MKPSSLGYLFKQGWKSMAANRLMTFASIGVLTACLIITGIASLISINLNRVVDYFGSQNEIVVYVQEGLEDAEIAQLGENIKAMDNVASVVFKTKAEAFDEVQGWLEDSKSLIRGLENIFPASYRVTVENLELMEQTNAQIRTLPGIDETTAASEVSGILVTIRNAVTYGGWALVIILAIVSVIVISNTIRLTVFARRREISIMKYVGATNSFIRTPFFIEGMTVGALAGILATGIICGIYQLVFNWISASFNTFVMSIVSSLLELQAIWLPLLLCFMLFGIVIGGIGSGTSVRKHLKV